ncbi:MAG: DUF624 domain-containing protein [Ruminococcaceae bacterium]|nr:DUF624 domain-containing protein [Oscillospiraceae bacterium]
MGFFSNSYYKEGPGVEKNERKKKGFFAFFDIYFRNFWGLCSVSFVYTLISVLSLGFANGLAKAGMTHVARSISREKHSFLLEDFFETIKKNWKQSLALGAINMVITALLALDIWYFWSYITRDDLKELALLEIIGLGLALALAIVATYIKYYIWTMTITFSLTIKQMIKNSFQFVFLNFFKNVLVSILFGAIYFGLFCLLYINAYFMIISLALIIFVVPGFKGLLVQFLAFPSIKKYMIDPYYAEHKGEDIEKRRALGLDIPEDELENQEETEESVFTDTVSSSDNNDD